MDVTGPALTNYNLRLSGSNTIESNLIKAVQSEEITLSRNNHCITLAWRCLINEMVSNQIQLNIELWQDEYNHIEKISKYN